MSGEGALERVWVRPATSADAASVAAIFTFEEAPVPSEEMARRMAEVFDARLPWLVAEGAGAVVGYAYATRWKARSGYRFSVEITVYLEPNCVGQGIGTRLYAALFERLQALGVHAVIGGIALPNAGSVALHEKFGLEQVAHFRETGFKFGRWIDVGYWERIL
jgi:L-amino acid N-acyltransferase YncA